MCGILGIVAEHGEHCGLTRPQVIAMRDTMTARGPDDAGYFQQENVIFTHRRLAIRDMVGGRQPWLSADGRYVLIYNGEIYNDGELRNELSALGHRFRSRSDTEVVLAAFQQWGAQCLGRLSGMFAFGIYDFQARRLFLARDRFGVKPLYLWQHAGQLLFASSPAAFLKHPQFTKQPNLPALSHYLTTFRLTLGRDTLFAGVHQLLPGESLEWQDGVLSIERYWDYPQHADDVATFDEAVDELHTGLRDSVQARLASDVPVGMFLSGGVDSNTIACVLRERNARPLLGQCGGGEGGDDSDLQYARRCAQHVGFDFGQVEVSHDDYWDCWEWLLEENGQPLSTPTDVILYQLSRQMKQSAGVVLGGEGADELLCGYTIPHWAGHDYDRQQELQAGHWSAGSRNAAVFLRSLANQYGRREFLSPADHYLALNSLIPAAMKPALLQPWAWQQAGEDQPIWSFYSKLFEQYAGMPTQRAQTIVLHRVNLEGLLGRLDSSTMAAGLEARVPYTDHQLVEKMFRMPERYKIDLSDEEHARCLASADLDRRGSLQSKRLLRGLAKRLMPSELAWRPKASFPTPVQSWLRGPWEERVQQKLLTSPFASALFQPQALRELAGNVGQAGMWLWPILNVVMWGDAHFSV